MKRFLENNFWKLFSSLYLFLIPVISFATGVEGEPSDLQGKIINPLGATSTIPALIQKVLEGALKIGIPIIALAIIYSGFLFVMARGNSEKIGKAKDTLLYTIIGAAILLGSWAIAKMITSTVSGLALL
jgi:hypothetical protein